MSVVKGNGVSVSMGSGGQSFGQFTTQSTLQPVKQTEMMHIASGAKIKVTEMNRQAKRGKGLRSSMDAFTPIKEGKPREGGRTKTKLVNFINPASGAKIKVELTPTLRRWIEKHGSSAQKREVAVREEGKRETVLRSSYSSVKKTASSPVKGRAPLIASRYEQRVKEKQGRLIEMINPSSGAKIKVELTPTLKKWVTKHGSPEQKQQIDPRAEYS